jgi:hypothetical protein
MTETIVINNQDYKFKVKKTWIPIVEVWHIEFYSDSVDHSRWECFLTDDELTKLKQSL